MVLNPKAKGNHYEKEWAEFIKEIDSSAQRNYGSGAGVAKSDVHNGLGYEFECKRVERLNIYGAIAEAERHAAAAHSIPAIVFRRNRMESSYVAIPDWHFRDLVRKSKEPKTATTENRALQWKIKQSIQALKMLLKELEI